MMSFGSLKSRGSYSESSEASSPFTLLTLNFGIFTSHKEAKAFKSICAAASYAVSSTWTPSTEHLAPHFSVSAPKSMAKVCDASSENSFSVAWRYKSQLSAVKWVCFLTEFIRCDGPGLLTVNQNGTVVLKSMSSNNALTSATWRWKSFGSAWWSMCHNPTPATRKSGEANFESLVDSPSESKSKRSLTTSTTSLASGAQTKCATPPP